MSVPGFLSDAERDRLEAEFPHLKDDVCPTCRGAKAFRWQGEDRTCQCIEQKRLNTRYLHAGIGMTYQRLMWSDLVVPGEQLEPVIDYMDEADEYAFRGMGLLLHGPVGTGKTLIANLVAKELVKKDYSTYVTTFAATVESFTSTWGDKNEKKVFADRFMHSQMLVLDDLGKEFKGNNKLPQSTFEHILRTRVQANRPTILTTNMTAQELAVGYGSAALSMLVEKSVEVPLTGADFRPQANTRAKDEIAAREVRPIT